ncbi:MAG: Asp-tRNA(Asn)/Glu-tRNA(Gln) amidotransferase subunit GatC [Clostridiales bacterium]|nr:Asp-tRNA(Asn)/Glu-tRNA(Gln) amidotransferase subunit GatC [Clostridiales bacterium]
MEITIDLVKHLANLSRLNFSDDELENFKNEFVQTLNQIDELQSVDTDNVVPYSNLIDAEDLREDTIKPSLSNEEVLKNAPKKSRGAIVVPKVVE